MFQYVCLDIRMLDLAQSTQLGAKVSHQISNIIEKYAINLERPMPNTVSPEALNIYKAGLDKANEYRGDPIILREALNWVQQTNCMPLFTAGVAYIHFVGSYIRGIEYDKHGLAMAEKWIRKAEALTYTLQEILTVKAFINVHQRELDQAARNLNDLNKFQPLDFYSLSAFLDFYAIRNDKKSLQETYQKTLQLPLNKTQKAYVLNRIGRYFLILRMTNASLRAYRELSKLTPNDPWMWHNMSMIYLAKKKTIRAWQCNKKALDIMEFGNAHKAQSRIKKKLIEETIQTVVAVVIIILLIIFVFN